MDKKVIKQRIFKGIKYVILLIILGIIFISLGIGGKKTIEFINQKYDSLMTTVEESNKVELKKVNDTLSSASVNISLNGYPLEINMSENNIYAEAQSLNTDRINTISINIPKNIKCFIDGKEVTNQKYQFKLEQLNQNKNINIILKNTKNSDSRKIIIPTLPKEFPKLEISGQNIPQLNGDYYGNIERAGDSYIYKLGTDGKLKYYYHCVNPKGSVSNFKKYVINNNIYYTYFRPIENYNNNNGVGINYGEVVVMDKDYKEIKVLTPKSTHKISQEIYTENHDYILLGLNHYVLLSEVLVPHKQKDGSIKNLRTPYIQEINNGKVVFQWLASDYPQLLETSVESQGAEKEDYMHTNSLTIDPSDNNFVISNRNLDSVLKIDRDNGKILWTLGGKDDEFGLNKSQQFHRQHYAYFDLNDNLLLFNNNNPEKKTNIMSFELDEDNKEVKSFKKYTFGKQFSPFCGSVQHITKELIFIGWGFSQTSNVGTLYNIKTNKVISDIVSNIHDTYRIQYFE